MKVSFDTKGGFDNIEKWMKNVGKRRLTKVDDIGEDGIRRLSQSTPQDTGETSKNWYYEHISTSKGVEIYWKNRAHSDEGVSIAKLIELGHGTGTGGYVPPRPYIKQAMKQVFEKGGSKLVEEMIK